MIGLVRTLGRETNNQAAAYRGDVTGDNVVDEADVRALARILVEQVSGDRGVSDTEVDEVISYVTRGGSSAGAAADAAAVADAERTVDSIRSHQNGFTVERLRKARGEADGDGPTAGGDSSGGSIYGRPPADGASSPGGSIYGGTAAGGGGGGSRSGASGGGGGGGGGPHGGIDLKAESSYRGRPPEYPPDQKKALGQILEESAPPSGAETDIDAINARRNRSLGGPLGTQKLDAALKRLAGRDAKAIPPADTPDIRLFAEGPSQGGRDKSLAGASGAAAGKDGAVKHPASNVALEFPGQDAANPKLVDRKKGGDKPLADDYRNVSADPGPPPDELSGLLDGDVAQVPDDPLLSQAMKDAVSTTALLGGEGAQGGGTVNRGDLVTKLFNPESATRMLKGSPESVGIKSGTTFHDNYADIAKTEIPKLIESGALPADVGEETLRTIDNILNPPPPPPAVATGNTGTGTPAGVSGTATGTAGVGATGTGAANPGVGSAAGHSLGGTVASDAASSGTPHLGTGAPPGPVDSGGCFVGETPILMADGTEKPIADIRVGDRVMTFDGLGGLVPGRVVRTFRFPRRKLLDVAGVGVTPTHRFLLDDGTFRAAGKLAPGDRLVTAHGGRYPIGRVPFRKGRRTVYNLTVDDLHVFVAGGFRVHNVAVRPDVLGGSQILK